jgi:ferredoxin
MADMKEALAAFVPPRQIHVEIFNGSESRTPGIVGGAVRAPHLPEDDADTGPLVSFARSGIAAHWKALRYQSILELAEACDVPVRWACRSGVCHNCESGLVSGRVAYDPQPLDEPAAGNLLVCCSQPVGDVVIDL